MTAKNAEGYPDPTAEEAIRHVKMCIRDRVKNRHEGYGIAAEGYASLQGKMKSTKTDMDDLLKLLPNGDGDVLNEMCIRDRLYAPFRG